MSSDQDQVLYGSCAVSEPGSGVCGTTVPDILLNTPLCSKHITKSVSYFIRPHPLTYISITPCHYDRHWRLQFSNRRERLRPVVPLVDQTKPPRPKDKRPKRKHQPQQSLRFSIDSAWEYVCMYLSFLSWLLPSHL